MTRPPSHPRQGATSGLPGPRAVWHRPRVRLLLWRLRRPVAAVCAALAATLTVQAVRAPGPPTVATVVAARDLPAGTTLTAEHLITRELVAGDLPADSPTSASALLGARTAIDVPAGLPLVDSLFVTAIGTGPPGTVVVPVRLSDDAVAALLSPGHRIDVIAVDPGNEPRTIATAALVLTATEAGSDSGGGLLGGSTSTAGPLLLAVDPEDAVQLSAAGTSASLTAILVE